MSARAETLPLFHELKTAIQVTQVMNHLVINVTIFNKAFRAIRQSSNNKNITGFENMKGIIFTEFLEMVEEKFSPEVADKIIEASDLVTGGAYTSVGTYHHSELIEMVGHLSKESGVEVVPLVKVFGEHLFGRFVDLYPEFFEGRDTCFSFLGLIENHVHVEVQKLYPDAELPTFATEQSEPDKMEMTYQSVRPFAPVAEGLILGCIAHFKENITVSVEDLSGDGTHARFTLEKVAA